MDFTEKENAEYKNSLEDFVNLFEVTMKFSQKVALLESLYVIFEKKGFCSKITQEMCDEILGSSYLYIQQPPGYRGNESNE